MRNAKRVLAAWMVLAVLSGLSGCAPSPDGPIVAQKNNDRLVEAAKEEPETGKSLGDVAEKTQENYTFTYENEDKTLVIQADAGVWVPEGEAIPMYRVEGCGFTQELVNKMYDYFFPDGGTYVTEGTKQTKEYWDGVLLKYEQRLAQVKADQTMEEQDRQNLIADMEASMERAKAIREDAPEESTFVKIPTGPEMTDQSETAIDACTGFLIQNDDASCTVTSADADSAVSSGFYYDKEMGEWHVEEAGAVLVNEENEAAINQGRLNLTLEDARAYAEDFFETIGVPVQEVAAYFVEKTDTEYDDFGNGEIRSRYYSYRFHFTRIVNGLPLATSTIHEVSSDEAMFTWVYERIIMEVNDEGICSLHWQDPLTVTDTVSENVGILSFDEAAEVFETMVPLTYQGEIVGNTEETTCSLDIQVDRASLTLLRVRDAGGQRTGLLTPVWTFYGCINERVDFWDQITDERNFDEYQTEAPYIILAVNAVDGSVIDLVEGY